MPAIAPAPPLRWLFLDLNSYFASVEQHLRPQLRGKPVAVVPMISDSTCAIAASYQAKRFGVKTGTNIGDARRMCPGLILVEARHDKYVEFHELILKEIERHYPVQVIASIDEVGLLLDRKRCQEDVALELAGRIKGGLARNIGETITCSIGIAQNRYLAKVASDLQKPDGLVVLRISDLPGRLSHCHLNDLPGIGRKMEPRLHQRGIHTIENLWDATPRDLHEVWGGIQGERFWRQLHGGDLDELPEVRRSIGHSQVLAPQFRRPPDAEMVAKRLLLKTASRLRRYQCRATEMSLSVRTETREKGAAHQRFTAVSDSFELLQRMQLLWGEAMAQVRWNRIKKIGITLQGLEAESAPEQLDLFPGLGGTTSIDRERRDKLSEVMDAVNKRQGRDSIALGFLPDAVRDFSGPKIAFNRIPEQEEFNE